MKPLSLFSIKKTLSLLALLILTNSSMAQIITNVAGSGVAGFNDDGGPATATSSIYPTDVAADRSGNIFGILPRYPLPEHLCRC